MALTASITPGRVAAEEAPGATSRRILLLPISWKSEAANPEQAEARSRIARVVHSTVRAVAKAEIVDEKERDQEIARQNLHGCLEDAKCRRLLARFTGADSILWIHHARLSSGVANPAPQKSGAEKWSFEGELSIESLDDGGGEAGAHAAIDDESMESLEKRLASRIASLLGAPRKPVAEGRPTESANPEGSRLSRRTLFIAGGSAGAAAGVFLLAYGITYLAIDGKGTCADWPARRCPEQYATFAPGMGLTVAGGALLAAGGAAVLLGLRMSEKPIAISPIVTPGGLGLFATGRF